MGEMRSTSNTINRLATDIIKANSTVFRVISLLLPMMVIVTKNGDWFANGFLI